MPTNAQEEAIFTPMPLSGDVRVFAVQFEMGQRTYVGAGFHLRLTLRWTGQPALDAGVEHASERPELSSYPVANASSALPPA